MTPRGISKTLPFDICCIVGAFYFLFNLDSAIVLLNYITTLNHVTLGKFHPDPVTAP